MRGTFYLLFLTTTLACEADAPAHVTVEGDVMAFLTEVPGPRVQDATVSILEHPESEVSAGDDAHFVFEGLREGEPVTLVVEHPDLMTTQSATVTPGANGVTPFSVQVLPKALFTALEQFVPEEAELDRFCVIATTVARTGGSLYVHLRQGMPDVQVSLDPPVGEQSGPIYFDESVLPNTSLTSTTVDGGAFFYRVPPGAYTLRATKADTVFNEVKVQCRAGVIVNAGPPLGLVANLPQPDYGAGQRASDNAFTEASDALCEATADCVNAEDPGHYPASTLDACRAMFRNVWANVDATCDAEAGLREAARATYACRTKTCELTLGHDEACVEEEVAFRAAETTYGQCMSR